MLPEAHIVHRTARRLRLRVRSRKGSDAYFSGLEKALAAFYPFDRIASNAVTGSLLLEADDLDADALAAFAEKKGLFALALAPASRDALPSVLTRQMAALDGQVRRATQGQVDLATAIFVALVVFGLAEIAAGNFKRPPWYTAFWYSFGVFSKVLIDRAAIDRP